MSTQSPVVRVTPEGYLRTEERGEIRHELVHGQVLDRVGGTDTHNLISLNIASGLRERLRGRPCRVFMADMKVRVAPADVFYYPDVFVTCDSRDRESYFKEYPCLIVEVLSASTEGTRIDGRSSSRTSSWTASRSTSSFNSAVVRSNCFGETRRAANGPSRSTQAWKKWPSSR